MSLLALLDDDLLWPLSVRPRAHSTDKAKGGSGERTAPLSRYAGETSRFGACDVNEHEDGTLEFKVDAPGLTKDDFHVEVSPDHVLTISGSRKQERSSSDDDDVDTADGDADKKGNKVVRRWRERSFSSFTRSFQLSDSAKVEDIQASAEHGVLTLTVPGAVKRPPEPKRIKVN